MRPSEDRMWRSLRWVGYGIPALAVLAAASYFTSFMDTWGTSPSALAQLDWYALGSSLLCLLIGVAACVFMLWQATLAGRRQRLRARAMAGDDRAMPLAAIEPRDAPAGEAMDEPLALLWRPPQSWWITALVMVVVIGLGLLVMLVSRITPGASSQALWVGLGVLGGAWALFAGLMVAFVAYWRKGASGVVATGEGLRRLQAGKERAFIPWSEARLFEVSSATPSASQSARGFALMSERALIEWVIHPPGNALPADDGASYEEMRRRGLALVKMVNARTGLALRTCQPELAAREDAGSAASWLG